MKRIISLLLFAGLLSLGCSFLSGGVSDQDIQSTVAAGIAKTQAAQPAPTGPPAVQPSKAPAPAQKAQPTSAPASSTCDVSNLAPKPSGYVSKVTMAQSVQGVNMTPVNPTKVFSPDSTLHAVVTIKNAPNNTAFKIIWYANDTQGAAPCNSFIGVYVIPTGGTRNIDFNTVPTSKWPVGTYRAEIYVNDVLDTVMDFSVK